MLLDAMTAWDAEEVLAVRDRDSGLRAFICIADTRRGPAGGGTRCRVYPSEAAQMRDGLRLAHAMVRKMALAGRWAGGGKIVVHDHPDMDRPAAFRALGRALAHLGGRMYTGPDLGVSRDDLLAMRGECRWVNNPDDAEWDGTATARTIVEGAAAACDLQGKRVAIQGIGLIGRAVLQACDAAGAHCIVADPSEGAITSARTTVPGCEVVDPAEILTADCDVLIPCAVGDVITPELLPQLRCSVVAPGANNVLVDEGLAQALHERGITYVPDYLCNSGAAIAWDGPVGPAGSTPQSRLDAVAPRIRAILEEAKRRDVPPLVVAEERAQAALAERPPAPESNEGE
jgi:leucine dehydrogenase